MLTDDEIKGLSPDERREMMLRLVDADQLPAMTSGPRAFRAFFLRMLLVATLLLIPWIIFLAMRLPKNYTANNWDLAWAGFDVALLVALGFTAWAVWKRRMVVIPLTIISGTLLLCDAWFDILTSRPGHDQTVSILSAVLIEVPLALIMFYASYRLVRMSARTVSVLFGGNGEVPHLWRQPLVMVQARRLLGMHRDEQLD